jgi:predicted NBD/HSP70 family sugar kinase
MNDESNSPDIGCGPILPTTSRDAKPLRQQIFEYIRASGLVPRMDVAKALNISAGSVTTLTQELITAGFLQEFEGRARDTARGRPPVALGVAPATRLVVGMKLSDRVHSAVLLDFAGNQLAEASLNSPVLSQHIDIVTDEAETLLVNLMKNAGRPRSDVEAIGLGLPGIVDHDTGHVPWSPVLTERDVNVKAHFEARLGLPVHVDNDANVLTLAELWFGAGRAMSDFAVVTIERGVGMGLVLDNRLFRGGQGLGLEVGHTKVQLDGALCRCGQRGCLEAYVADYALGREASTALNLDGAVATDAGQMLERLYAEAKGGNEAARAIFHRAGRYLAVALANVSQLFDPAKIILSGEHRRFDYFYDEDVLAEMQKLTLGRGRPPTPVESHTWGDLVWARGAAALGLSALTNAVLGEGRVSA